MNIPEPQIDAKLIDDMAKGYQVTQVLYTATDFDIFTLLEKPKTAKEVTDELGTDSEVTKKLLDVLVALQLLSETDGKYANTTLAVTFLVKGKPFYQGNLINIYRTSYNVWSKLGHALKDGIQQKTEDKPEFVFDKSFTIGMAESSLRGPLHKVVRVIRDIPEFKNAKKLLDLGGGHGLYAIAFAQMNPDLEAIVFDLPSVVEMSKEFISQYGMADRVKVMAGDLNKDDLGDGYDIIFVSHLVFYYAKEAIHEPLERIYNALNAGGILISNHWMHAKGSLTLALLDLCSSLLGYPMHAYTKEECFDLLKEKKFSGMQMIDIVTPEDPSSIVIAKREVQ